MNTPETNVRLQKILSERGIASRREAETLITSGAVKVNGKTVTTLGSKADPNSDIIEVDQQVIQEKEATKFTIAIWKPVGFVTSTKKTQTEGQIVFDLLPGHFPRLFPVGRLDKDSSGLLILTNDGDLAYRLTHPSFQHAKTYHVLLHKPIQEASLEKIRQGRLRVLGEQILPAEAKILGGSRVEVILRQGKNRQIRRMFRALENGVKKLRRVAIGRLTLENLRLNEGGWRKLNPREIDLLLQDV